MNKLKHLLGIAITTLALSLGIQYEQQAPLPKPKPVVPQKAVTIVAQKETVMTLSLKAYRYAIARGITTKSYFVVVDYTKPATEKRFFVVDGTGKILFSTYMAHGVNSGKGSIFKSYSNKINSLQSSIGVFITKSFFNGKHGLSLEMEGLDGKFNSNAFERRILIHTATYAGVKKPGNSYGCFAIPMNEAKLIKYIGTGVLLIAYYPDKDWLNTSKFLAG